MCQLYHLLRAIKLKKNKKPTKLNIMFHWTLVTNNDDERKLSGQSNLIINIMASFTPKTIVEFKFIIILICISLKSCWWKQKTIEKHIRYMHFTVFGLYSHRGCLDVVADVVYCAWIIVVRVGGSSTNRIHQVHNSRTERIRANE